MFLRYGTVPTDEREEFQTSTQFGNFIATSPGKDSRPSLAQRVRRLPWKRFDDPSQFDNFEVWWTLLPVVPPTNNDIAPIGSMTMRLEVATLKLKLDAHSFPFPGLYFPFAFAIRVGRLDGFDEVTEFLGYHSE
jgi:hypothetical protein